MNRLNGFSPLQLLVKRLSLSIGLGFHVLVKHLGKALVLAEGL